MDKSVFQNYFWLNPPSKFEIKGDELVLVTEPETDLWQGTYYGFRKDDAHAFLTETTGDFTYTVKTSFEDARSLYDQCGVLMYVDRDNWIKASVEYENETFSRVGSVVTNGGYSDWATTDIPSSSNEMWYRLSRCGQDFYIENSVDGKNFNQMRMLHMHLSFEKVNLGVYACSPQAGSFKAIFSEMKREASQWHSFNKNN